MTNDILNLVLFHVAYHKIGTVRVEMCPVVVDRRNMVACLLTVNHCGKKKNQI